MRFRSLQNYLHRLVEAGVRHGADAHYGPRFALRVTLVAVSPSLITRLKPLVGGSKKRVLEAFFRAESLRQPGHLGQERGRF